MKFPISLAVSGSQVLAAGLAMLFNPATGEVVGRVPFASAGEVRSAVESSRAAQIGWAALNSQRRARVFLRFVRLLEEHADELAESLSREHGKTIPDAKGDIQRGLEVCEYVCGAPELLKGEFSWNAGGGIDMYSMRQPVGVGAGNNAVQLSGDDPDVDVCSRHRLRQRIRSETVRTRSVGASTPGGVDDRIRSPSGSPQCDPRRPGGRGGALRG